MDEPKTSPDLLLEDRFAIVPEWLLDADISDAAVRLYAILLRYGQSSGARMPSRSTLALRIHKRSTDSVDRAMKDLIRVGAVRIEHRYDGAQRLTNAYHVRTSRPSRSDAPTPPETGSRKSAATPTRRGRGGRTDAARVAADPGHDPEHSTQSNTPSSPRPPAPTEATPDTEAEIATACGIEDWAGYVEDIHRARRHQGAPVGRWAGPSVAAALHEPSRV